MIESLSSPPIQPLQRLQVTDGLLINADRWHRAHHYHRQRQNLHYQAVNQAGIVCGLGVRLIPAPDSVPAKYKDGRWLEIQPGMAIDPVGNVIIVPNPEVYRIVSEPSAGKPIVVYLVVRYVDPDKLERKEQPEFVAETFRIDEKSRVLDALDVEVCRLLLHPGVTQLRSPQDVFFPGPNELDLRNRVQAQSRSQAQLKLLQLTRPDPDHARNQSHLVSLMQSVNALYPQLQGDPEITSLPLSELQPAIGADVVYLTGQQPLNSTEITTLKGYLQAGGILLVNTHAGSVELAKSVMDLAHQLKTPLEYLDRLNRNHPLRTQPFLFAALPTLHKQALHLLVGGGIIMAVGDLASGWGLDEQLSLSRETIRSAQELGINILHFAWKRRQMMTVLGQPIGQMEPAPSPATARPPSGTETTTKLKGKTLLDSLLE